MKIIGIGVDIVENNRFKKLIKKKRFINHICLKDFLLRKHLLKP